MASIPTSFNPSDYQFLLKSAGEGNYSTKAQSLKRFNTLVTTDKKQFSIYAKRIVLTIQDLLLQPREDINLLACTLALQIINLNPREIQYYVRTKLLKNLIKNLGDARPQIRKTSHYCLLAYVKTYKSFDELIPVYISYGINSNQWQLRQKSINSFQSILIMEMKFLNWSSGQFRKVFQLLLVKLKDQSQFVQKASQQCLLSLCKIDQIRSFSKKLSNNSFELLKQFCQLQKQIGNLIQIKLDIDKPITLRNSISLSSAYQDSHKTFTNVGQSLLNFQKVKPTQNQKQSIINRIQQIRRNSQTPKLPQSQQQIKSLKKVQSVIMVTNKKQINKQQKKQQIKQQSKSIAMKYNKDIQQSPPLFKRENSIQVKNANSNIQNNKSDKIQNVLGRRLIDDLKNQKDWKVRLEAVQQLQTRFQMHKDTIELQSLSKTFMPTLIKLLADQNFKVALISLKIIQQILHFPSTNISLLVPQIVDKLSDSKIALRQNISKLIRSQYSRTKQNLWIYNLLQQIKKTSNSSIKQQIITILSKMYQDDSLVDYSYQQVIDTICPLMEDLKTKIKIKTLDLLVMITMKTKQIDNIKNLLMGKMNQVYYQMYCQKVHKQLKQHNLLPQKIEKDRSTTNPGARRYAKNSGNTTSTSLQRYSHTDQQSNSNRNNSFNNQNQLQKKSLIINQQRTVSQMDPQLGNIDNQDDLSTQRNKKPILKSFRKKVQKTFDYKSTTNYSNNQYSLPPFNDPDKQLKNILSQLKSDDWQVSFQALTKLRRIVQHHSHLITHSIVRLIMPQMMRLAESLRSSLSKNAVITLNEMSIKLKKLLDTQLDLMFNKLIKKTLDANSFISDQVKKALVSVCSNSNQARIISLLVSAHTSRALPIKVVITHILENIVFLPKFYEKQLQKIVSILVDFMGQGSLQVRQKTKSILSSILSSQKGSSIIKLIPPQHLQKLKRKQQHQIHIQQPIHQEVQIKNQGLEQQQIVVLPTRKRKSQKITSFPIQFNQLQSLLEKCQSSDWKSRVDNMSQIYSICQKYPQEAFQYRLSSRIIDVLSQQISDPNAKVATNALKIFMQLARLIPSMIQYNLSVIINSIFNCFASHKPQIKSLSQQLFTVICQKTQKWMLLQHICQGCLYGIQKSRPLILQKLTQIVGDIYDKKPNIFNKNIFPMINKLVEQNRPQLNPQIIELLKQCYQQIGPQMLNLLKPKARQLISEYI